MIADVVEETEVKNGRRSEGLFFAANIFVAKAVSGVGIFASSMVLLAIGFPDNAKPGEVGEDVIRNLGLTYIPALAVTYLVAIGALTFFRITRASHEANLARLAERPGG
jgi:Na+/melibiose symporter-like transporter